MLFKPWLAIIGTQLVPPAVAFGTLDSTTAGYPSMLGAHGLWPPLGINPLELSMRVPPLSMPVLPAANIAGPALVGGNVVYHTPHPLAATSATSATAATAATATSSWHSGPATATASMMNGKGGVAGAHGSPARDMAMMGMYGTAGAGLDGHLNPGVSPFFSSTAAGFPVPSNACKRRTGGTKDRDPSHIASEGQTIAETEDGELNNPTDLVRFHQVRSVQPLSFPSLVLPIFARQQRMGNEMHVEENSLKVYFSEPIPPRGMRSLCVPLQ